MVSQSSSTADPGFQTPNPSCSSPFPILLYLECLPPQKDTSPHPDSSQHFLPIPPVCFSISLHPVRKDFLSTYFMPCTALGPENREKDSGPCLIWERYERNRQLVGMKGHSRGGYGMLSSKDSLLCPTTVVPQSMISHTHTPM